MLVLGRKEQECVNVYYQRRKVMQMTILKVDGGNVKVGFNALPEYDIKREEIDENKGGLEGELE
ncbi:MAG: carbon storage regulator [Nanoarchaeota archaeon]